MMAIMNIGVVLSQYATPTTHHLFSFYRHPSLPRFKRAKEHKWIMMAIMNIGVALSQHATPTTHHLFSFYMWFSFVLPAYNTSQGDTYHFQYYPISPVSHPVSHPSFTCLSCPVSPVSCPVSCPVSPSLMPCLSPISHLSLIPPPIKHRPLLPSSCFSMENSKVLGLL